MFVTYLLGTVQHSIALGLAWLLLLFVPFPIQDGTRASGLFVLSTSTLCIFLQTQGIVMDWGPPFAGCRSGDLVLHIINELLFYPW